MRLCSRSSPRLQVVAVSILAVTLGVGCRTKVGDNEEMAPDAETSSSQGLTEDDDSSGSADAGEVPPVVSQVSAATVSPDEFQQWLSTQQGRVVLVDFWATWCGPCRQEVPNILEMYDAYHEKGFDVLGVSLDESADKAQDYIESNDIPWPSLFPAEEDQRGWDHPLVEYYAINGIPTAILVDADGRVVHMNARGRNLREQLQKLLGDPVEREDEAAEDEAEEDTAAAS